MTSNGRTPLLTMSVSTSSSISSIPVTLASSTVAARRKALNDPAGLVASEFCSVQVVDLVSGKLSYLRPHAYSVEVAYWDFLNRVRMEEESLRRRGLWDVPHPWLNLFVPRHGVARFMDLLMATIAQGDFEGPVLVYPLLTHRYGATHVHSYFFFNLYV